MRIAYIVVMDVIGRWHEAVNSGDLAAARDAVADPIVVNEPKGAGPITPDAFADWITRSGVRLLPRSWHAIGARVTVVEQDARWPQDEAWSRVATVFRTDGGLVSAALRFPSLREALDFAHLHVSLAATEGGGSEGGGRALFQFVRHWSRRRDVDGAIEQGPDVLVVEAVHALRDRAEVTVNGVAGELALDQSGASRMLAHAVSRGLLTTGPSPLDARRRTFTLTDVGREFLAAAHRWQDATFAALTDDWTAEERAQFHHAMTKLLTRPHVVRWS